MSRSGALPPRDDRSPSEKYEEFKRENDRWRRRVEKELDEVVRELVAEAVRSKDERAEA
jgi:uncharacterized NAD(P)/FAD-binding protein YdhS